MRLLNVECTIHTEDGPLAEYQHEAHGEGAGSENDPAAASPEKTVFVQAKDDHVFWVDLTIHDDTGIQPAADSVAYGLFCDGKKCDIRDDLIPLNVSFPHTCTYHGPAGRNPDGSWGRQKLQFSALNVLESRPSDNVGADNAHKLGEIEVFLYRTKRLRPTPYIPTGRFQFKGQDSIHQKAMKKSILNRTGELSHSVRLGEDERIGPISCWHVQYMDTSQKPYAIFRFLYRSERALQHLGLIPRTPVPSPPPMSPVVKSEPVLDGMSREQLEEEIRQLRRFKAENRGRVKLKRERSPEDPTPGRPGPRKRRRRMERDEPKVLIDLTTDDD